MIHNQYKVKFSGMCIMSLASSKKKSIGMWHKKGNRCNSSQIVLMTFAEPTDEIMMQAVQFTNPHLIIDKVSWEFIGAIEEAYATKTLLTND